MKLRNKKTGEIGDGVKSVLDDKKLEVVTKDKIYTYDSLAELNEEWEDYEEPRDYWYIDSDGKPLYIIRNDRSEFDNNHKEIGNYFATKKEAKKAIEKLKAWKRLKDKGFKPIDWAWHKVDNPNRDDFEEMVIKVYFRTDQYVDDWDDDLDLLFGGEE